MSSSISSSDDTALSSAWDWWLAIVAFAPAGFAVIYGLTILLDPFSTGRYTPIMRVDVAARDIFYGNSARARDPTINAGIIGNSYAVLLDPKRLTAASGLRFAQLSSLGLNPSELLMIAAAFARGHRGHAHTIVLVLDQGWCSADEPYNRVSGFFPSFLFESSPIEYLRNLMTPRAVEAAAYRLLMLVGLAGDRKPRDGYAPMRFTHTGWTAEKLASFANIPRPTQGPALKAPIPAFDRLRASASKFGPETELVLLFAPVPFFELPVPGSAAASRLAYCKSRYQEFARTRPGTAFIDRMLDDALANDMNNFGDTMHLRNRMAPLLEGVIVSALQPM